MIRAALAAKILAGREVLGALVVSALGLWVVLASTGGWITPLFGLCLCGFGLSLALIAWRRMRFAGGAGAGVVQVVEGRVGYFGPLDGGFVDLADLAELRVTGGANRQWVLRTIKGEVLQIPVDAKGGEVLFDAFASMPNLPSGKLVAALFADEPRGLGGNVVALHAPQHLPPGKLVWARAGKGVTLH